MFIFVHFQSQTGAVLFFAKLCKLHGRTETVSVCVSDFTQGKNIFIHDILSGLRQLLSNVIPIASLVSEIWLATERHPHSLGSTIKYTRILFSLFFDIFFTLDRD